MIGGAVWAAYQDKKEWNNGGCSHCEKGWWEAVSCDSSGCTGYRCTNCGTWFWESGWINHSK